MYTSIVIQSQWDPEKNFNYPIIPIIKESSQDWFKVLRG